jgi:hypothetical protein
MPMPIKINSEELAMEPSWQQIEAAAMENLQVVEGGFTAARRGLVELEGGQRVFIKQAVDSVTQRWLDLEKRAYHWLSEQGYQYAPPVVAEGSDGFALPDLSALDWSKRWTEAKLEAAFRAMDSLAALSGRAEGQFKHFAEPDFWPGVPADVTSFSRLTEDEAVLATTQRVISNEQLRTQMQELAAQHPEQGSTLVHLDVRADNFCYD